MAGNRSRLTAVMLVAVALAACQLLPRGETSSPAPSESLPLETVPPGYSLPPTRDLLSPEPPATVQPIASP